MFLIGQDIWSVNYDGQIVYLGYLIVLHGLIYFNLHGANFITPTGLYLLYCSLLHGFASISLGSDINRDLSFGHFLASLILYFSQILIYFLILENGTHFQVENRPTPKKTTKIKRLLLFLLVLGFILSKLHSSLNFFFSAMIYVSTVVLSLDTFILNKKITIINILLWSALVLFYFKELFSGFGRINIVTLVIANVMLLAIKINKPIVKRGMTIMFVPSIIMGSLLRGGTSDNLLGGIGSIVSPLLRFGDLLNLYIKGDLDLSFGKTIYAAFIVFIPRELWNNKPWNFNREITYIFTPQYVENGHSEAAVLAAEFLFNFGFIGVIIGFLFFSLFLRFLDRKIFNIYLNKTEFTILDLINFSVIIIISAGLLNLMWGGFSTQINRDGFRILALYTGYFIYKALFMKKTD
ncbi:hypothetical protein ACRCJN_00310 [Aerococcus urinaeequi]|uniref:hypothetical protein n=1 Tax=Aerococcus urinaeequi TaxID=51665 RepID=UPI003D6B11D9